MVITMRNTIPWLLPWALCLVAVAAFAQQGQTPISGVYSCVDSKGRKLTSDRPIAECTDREQKVLNPSGTVRAKVGPTQTAQERADQEEREKQDAMAYAIQVEEKRRERALLVRYPSKQVHDKERSEAIAQVGVVIQAANKRIEELLQERRTLDGEMEFYKKDPNKAPPLLKRQFDDLSQSMASQKRFIGEQDNEIRRINARFDEELARLKLLWAAQTAVRPGTAAAKKTP